MQNRHPARLYRQGVGDGRTIDRVVRGGSVNGCMRLFERERSTVRRVLPIRVP